MSTPRIAIIGGGPGGLVLLNVLARHNVAATLYERDADVDSRAHLGGMLDMHVETGQAALKAAGPAVWDAFLKHGRPEGQEMYLMDKSGEPIFHEAPPQDGTELGRPEIDRKDLRQILIDGAPEGSIKWGYAFVSASPVAGTQEWELSFANGHKTVVDLVIGADGARSRVRPLVTDTQIEYSGITGAEVSFGPDVAAAHPELTARVGNGSAMALEEGQLLALQRNGNGRVRTYAWFHSDVPDVLPSDPAGAVASLLERYSGWAPWLRQIIELADLQAVYARPLFKLPIGYEWPHRAGVTLVGDAMNAMIPAGNGANVALHEGMLLGLALGGVRDGTLKEIDAAVAKYEEEARKLAVVAAVQSEKVMGTMIGPNGLRKMVQMFESGSLEGLE